MLKRFLAGVALIVILSTSCIPPDEESQESGSEGEAATERAAANSAGPQDTKSAKTLEEQTEESQQTSLPEVQRDPLWGAKEMTAESNDEYGEKLYRHVPSYDVYIVKAGDTASRIAIAQGLTLPQLLEANPELEDPNVLSNGQQIRIPGSDSATATADEQLSSGVEMTPDGEGSSSARLAFSSQPRGITFGEGSFRVGVDIPPGRYRSTNPMSTCLWERLSAMTEDISDIIGHEAGEGNERRRRHFAKRCGISELGLRYLVIRHCADYQQSDCGVRRWILVGGDRCLTRELGRNSS